MRGLKWSKAVLGSWSTSFPCLFRISTCFRVRALALFKVWCGFPKVLVPVAEGLCDFLIG